MYRSRTSSSGRGAGGGGVVAGGGSATGAGVVGTTGVFSVEGLLAGGVAQPVSNANAAARVKAAIGERRFMGVTRRSLDKWPRRPSGSRRGCNGPVCRLARGTAQFFATGQSGRSSRGRRKSAFERPRA